MRGWHRGGSWSRADPNSFVVCVGGGVSVFWLEDLGATVRGSCSPSVAPIAGLQ